MKFLVFFLVLSCEMAYGQAYIADSNTVGPVSASLDYVLVIQKRKGNLKQRYLVDNQRIKVFYSSGKDIAGKLQIINEDTIRVDNQRIAVTDITQINTYSVGFRAAGILLGGFGLSLNILLLTASEPLASLIVLPFTAGLSALMLIPRRFDIVHRHRIYFLQPY